MNTVSSSRLPVQGVSDLEQAMSATLDLVLKGWEACVLAWVAAARVYAGTPIMACAAHWWVL